MVDCRFLLKSHSVYSWQQKESALASGQPDTKRAFHRGFARFVNSVPDKNIIEIQFF